MARSSARSPNQFRSLARFRYPVQVQVRQSEFELLASVSHPDVAELTFLNHGSFGACAR